jgi:polyisoprenoid-binding protein YceI
MMRQIMHRLLITGALTAAATLAAAQESYTADPNHTVPSFEVTHGGDFTITRGMFQKTAGKITLDRTAKTGSIEIVIDTASVTTGHAKRDELLRSDSYFNVSRFPSMTFRSQNLKFSGDKPVSAEGELTLLGISKPVSLAITSFKCRPHPVNKRDQCGADGTAQIKRSEFGMTRLSSAGDDVKILFQIEAYKD